jgi:hypothetical protein
MVFISEFYEGLIVAIILSSWIWVSEQEILYNIVEDVLTEMRQHMDLSSGGIVFVLLSLCARQWKLAEFAIVGVPNENSGDRRQDPLIRGLSVLEERHRLFAGEEKSTGSKRAIDHGSTALYPGREDE